MENLNTEKQLPHNNPPFSDKDKVSKSQTIPIMNDTNQEKDKNKSQIENESSSDDSDLDLDSAFKCEVCIKTFSGLKPLIQHQKSAKHHKILQQKKIDKKISQKLEDDQRGMCEDLLSETYAECDVCKKQFSGPESYHQHLTSKVHQKKVAEVKFLEKVTENGRIDVEKLKEIYKQRRIPRKDISEAGAYGKSPTLEETEIYDQLIADSYQFECIECDKKFTGVNPWYQHLVSKTHEKTLKQRELLEKLKLGSPSRINTTSENILSNDMDTIKINDDILTCQLCHMSFSGPESVVDHLKSRGHAKKKEIKEWKMGRSVESTGRSPVETKKTKVLDKSNESQIVEDLDAASLPESTRTDVTQCTEDLKASLGTSDNVSNDPNLLVENDPGLETKNTLLCYKSYKAYKQIMNEIESKDRLM